MAMEIYKEMEPAMPSSLEDYKKLVFDCLMKSHGCTTEDAARWMREYEDDFQSFYEEKLNPETAAAGMTMYLL